MSLLQALMIRNIANGRGVEGLREDAKRVVGMQLAQGAFPGAHPVLVGALAERVTAKLNGRESPQLTAEELKGRVGNWAADTWIDNNFPALDGAGRDALHTAIVNARGW